MARPVYKTRKPKGISLELDICDILERYSKDTSIPESRVMDKALKEYFENHGIK